MLAINQNGELVDLSKYTWRSLTKLKKDTYYCRYCYRALFIRKGKNRRIHFVHYSEKSNQKGESKKHYQAKHALYNQFKSRHKKVFLEYYLKDYQIQPDILIQDNSLQAIEFQASRLSPKLISKRNEKYELCGLKVTWILDEKFLRRLSPNKIRIDASIKPFIKREKYNLKLFFYATSKKELIICDSLVFDDPTNAFAQITSIKLKHVSLKEITRTRSMKRNLFYQVWLNSLRNFRISPKKTNRKTFNWYNWLYITGYFYETIPSEFYLPVVHSHLYQVPIWLWQGHIIVMLNQEFKKDECVKIERIKSSLMSYIYPYVKHESNLIKQSLLHYLNQLVKCGVLLKQNGKYYKVREVKSKASLREALNKDNVIIEQLRYNLSNIS